MKELTYEDWLKNPTPRLMWVWDSDENNKEQRKVIYFLSPDLSFPVVALTNDKASTEIFRHCAEIEKHRRMTNKELSRWLREKPTREFKYNNYITPYVCSIYTYDENRGDEEARNDIVIREDYGEWREPIIGQE